MQKDIYTKRNDWAGFLLILVFFVTIITWYYRVYKVHVLKMQQIEDQYEFQIKKIHKDRDFKIDSLRNLR